MIIGDVSFSEVTRALHPEQSALGREINPTVMSAAEFSRGGVRAMDLCSR